VNRVGHQPSAHLSTALKPCHPERSLAESEANRQTQSKDPYQRDTALANERNFRIAVRFFDADEAEHRPVSNREAAAWESPARQCRGCAVNEPSPAGTALSHNRMTQ
jgi:hypothetical protein